MCMSFFSKLKVISWTTFIIVLLREKKSNDEKNVLIFSNIFKRNVTMINEKM